MYRAACLVAVVMAAPVAAQSTQAVRFTENFGKDVFYSVNCQVSITGVLPGVPTEKEPKPAPMQLLGRSSIKYDERILHLKDGQIERTLRQYREMDFYRTVDKEVQKNSLRPEVRRVIILRHHQYEVPFCPTAPLTWGEIELVRTDVFAPALAGLYPSTPMSVGQKWPASLGAVQELTDLEKIETNSVTCTFETLFTSKESKKRYAIVSFNGTAEGLSEDGTSKHVVDGKFYYDIDANFLAYLTVDGTHHLLHKGKEVGKISGKFTMSRSRTPLAAELTDAATKGMVLEPTVFNSQLLFEHPTMGVRIMHPRNWRVVGGTDKQIGIDENRGNGMLITLVSGPTAPTGAQYYKESKAYLQKQQSKILQEENVKVLAPGVETFVLMADVAKQTMVLRYYVIKQGNQTATIAVRMAPATMAATQQDVDRMVESLRLGGKK